MLLFTLFRKRFLCLGLLACLASSCLSPKFLDATASLDLNNQAQGGNSKDDHRGGDVFENLSVMFSAIFDEGPTVSQDNSLWQPPAKKENNLLLRTGLQFIGKGYKSGAVSPKTGIHLNYLELPVYAVYQYPVSSGTVFGGGGPYFAYGIGGKIKSNNFSASSFGENNGGYKRLDAGLGLLAGYRMDNGFVFHLSYELGLANVAYASQDFTAHNRTFSINVGYDISRLFHSK